MRDETLKKHAFEHSRSNTPADYDKKSNRLEENRWVTKTGNVHIHDGTLRSVHVTTAAAEKQYSE